MNLTALGVGAIIGTGIFVLTGTVAAQNAGPRWCFRLCWPESHRSSLRCVTANSPRCPDGRQRVPMVMRRWASFCVDHRLGFDSRIRRRRHHGRDRMVGLRRFVPARFRYNIPPTLSAARGTELIQLSPALAEVVKAKAGWIAIALLSWIKSKRRGLILHHSLR